MPYIYLLIAIIAEIFATTLLKDTNGFTVLVPSILTIAGYVLTFYMLSLCIQYIPTGIIYAVWSGVGIIGIAIAGWIIHKQVLDLPAILGIIFILAGVLIIKLFSKAVV